MSTSDHADDKLQHEAAAPTLGPSTDVTLGDETMELLAYGDLEGAKARHDGRPTKGKEQQVEGSSNPT